MELFEACVAHGEAMVQALAGKIADEDTWDPADSDAWWLPFHAALILGRIPSESSGALLAQLMQKIDTRDEQDLQDWLAGDWPALFKNKPIGVLAAVRELTTNTTLDWYVRCQGVEVVLDAGMRQGADALDAEIDWGAGLASNESDEWEFRIVVACALLDFPRQRHRSLLESMALEETRRAKRTGMLAGMFDLANVESAFSNNVDEPGWKRRDTPWNFYRPDAIAARQERWREEEEQAERNASNWDHEYPQVRSQPKIGRNDPCPCGSGKKYKKCCLERATGPASDPGSLSSLFTVGSAGGQRPGK